MRRRCASITARISSSTTGPAGEEAAINAVSQSEGPVAPSPADPTHLPHLPGLDGLRGLAVIGAILFHSGFSWAGGGFLGVSTFFVLSGFLITSLLLREWNRTGSVRLGRFWARRFRRLLPAALLALLLVALVWSMLGSAEQIVNLRYDTLAALAYVANWRFYFAGTSYAELFSSPSPLQHFWSLAIEEQFYLLFPPAVLALMQLGGRSLLVCTLCGAAALSVGLGFALGDDIDRVYYGTDTRAAELLAGALYALWWSGPRGRDLRVRSGSTDIAGALALGLMFWAWEAVSNTSPLLGYGGLPLYAILTTIIIHAAIQPGPVASLLSLPPLRWIGLISYGLYLYHWPIFLLLDEQRLGLQGVPLFLVQMMVTSLVSLASWRLLEMPIRRGRVLRSDRSVYIAALAGGVIVALCTILATLNPPPSTVPYANVRLDDFSSTVRSGTEPASAGTAVSAAAGSDAGIVMILGDSGTVDASPAIRAVFEAAGASRVQESAYPGVGLSNPLLQWREAYAELIDKDKPDLVIMMLGGWDIKFLQEQGTDAYTEIVDDAARILTAGGAKLLWLSMLPGGKTPDRSVNHVYEEVAERYPGRVAYVDIEASLRAPPGVSSPVTTPGAEDWPRAYTDLEGATVLLRKPDFWHLCPTGAARLATAINHAAADLGWAARAPDGWSLDNDAWRADRRYDDPSGACDIK